jgi:uncharacterized lipoprotein YbaY
MKKFILMLAVAASTALVACGSKEAATEEAPATDSIEVVEETTIEEPAAATDSVATDSVATEAAAPAAE